MVFRDLTDDFDHHEPDPELFLDVPFVPTDDAVLHALLRLADVNRNDVLFDLGSGDGRIVVAAAMQHHAHGIGIEIDPSRVADAMEYAAHSRVEHMVDFIEDDLFTADIRAATVVTLYLLDSINIQLRPRLLHELRPGTRVVSHAFGMGDWAPDERLEVAGVNLYKWIVPAQVAGTWHWEGLDGAAFCGQFEQTYQRVTGTVQKDGAEASLRSVTLCGARLDVHIGSDAAEEASRHFALNFENGELASVWEYVSDD